MTMTDFQCYDIVIRLTDTIVDAYNVFYMHSVKVHCNTVVNRKHSIVQYPKCKVIEDGPNS